jgi:hypothetical protein
VRIRINVTAAKMAVKPIMVSGSGHSSSGAIDDPRDTLIDWP